MPPHFLQVTVAINSEEGARKIAETLITKRLAASVWISSPIMSTYWWKGTVQQAQEWVCTAKTRDDLYPHLEQTIKSLHPYEVPGILATPIAIGSQSYLDWLERETHLEKDPHDQHEQHDHRQRTSKEQLLQELMDVHEKLISAATAAQERGVAQQDDRWGPREIVAHIAGWEANALIRTPRMIAGETALTYDHDAFNAVVITMIGSHSFETVRDILRQTYQHDIEMLREQENKVFLPGNPVYERIHAAIQHNHEHIHLLETM